MQRPGQSGIALVIVLWVIALLAVIAVSFTTATRGQANLVRNLVDNAKAEALADAGLYRAVFGLFKPRTEVFIDEHEEEEDLLHPDTQRSPVARPRRRSRATAVSRQLRSAWRSSGRGSR